MDFTFPKLPNSVTDKVDSPTEPLNPLLASATVRHIAVGASATKAEAQPVTVSTSTNMPAPMQRNKVPLEKGFSQVAWLRLTQTHPDLAGLNGGGIRGSISMEEVKQHKTEDDAWVVVRGKVYNITPYLRYHPGGYSILAKQAGQDCTALFNKYHAWVNADMLLQKCMIGMLEQQST